MPTITPERTVAEIVRERPARARVFESLNIDYCCGGKRTLQQACEKKQVAPDQIIALLEEQDLAHPQEDRALWDTCSLAELIENIIKVHHEYLRLELPRLAAMLSKVARVHGEKEPRLHQMSSVFERFTQELDCHMMKEEKILFPAIEKMEQSGERVAACFGSVKQPIAQMEAEHDGAGAALEDLKTLSDGYTPPDWACNTYRAMLDGLHDLEHDMHTHVHKENNVLFPRAIALEEALPAGHA